MQIQKLLKWAIIIAVGGFILIQLVPYGRSHDNPPVQSEPNWDSPETRALAVRACFDCHSNETNWTPWYTSVAPASWLVQHDVEDGRRKLNFSEWNEGGKPREIGEMWEVLEKGQMPLKKYLPLHPEAKLTQSEIDQLITGLQATSRN
ncbi:MAG: heme-binding domain-containing protein [Anaerolineales bacterium]|nr:heme-binding domain-containing protein [Anaerolineales bacterium]